MFLLSLASIVLIIAGISYAPKSLFKPKSTILKKIEKLKKYESFLGAVAIVLGLTLAGLFFFHIIKELKWIIILTVSLVSFVLGMVFAANNIKSLFQSDTLNKFIQVIEDFDKILKQNFPPKIISIFLFVLGFIGIISALTFDF